MFDPWHALGYYGADEDKNIVVVKIEGLKSSLKSVDEWKFFTGAAHCSDMYPSYEGEPAALPAARQQIADFLDKLISERVELDILPQSAPVELIKVDFSSATVSSG